MAFYPELAGKVAIVTGAGSGIGAAAAIAFAQQKTRVIVADIDEAGGKKTVDAITAAGGEAIFQRCDVARDSENRQLVERATETYGGLDYAFNNAGIAPPTVPIDQHDEDVVDRLLTINLKGVWSGMRYQIPAMLARGGGAIVNTSSITALVGDYGRSIYAATKGGIVAMTRVAAVEYASQNIRINAICPGMTNTAAFQTGLDAFGRTEENMQMLRGMQPIGRWAESSEMADAVLWLCSESASFVVGQPIVIDGGLVSR